jgi:hypothetical protein
VVPLRKHEHGHAQPGKEDVPWRPRQDSALRNDRRKLLAANCLPVGLDSFRIQTKPHHLQRLETHESAWPTRGPAVVTAAALSGQPLLLITIQRVLRELPSGALPSTVRGRVGHLETVGHAAAKGLARYRPDRHPLLIGPRAIAPPGVLCWVSCHRPTRGVLCFDEFFRSP